jgi:pilus assembly protein FimV
MAYGLYDQAADLVQVALKRDPDRRDLKLKLLEIYFVWGNRERFLELARELHGKRAGAAPGEWDKVLIMGKQLAADDPLFAGGSKAEPGDLDMELHGGERTPDFDLSTGVFPAASIDLTVREPAVGGAGGLDFLIDEPVRGVDEDENALAPTIESPRVKPSIEEPTAEVPIEDLGLDLEAAQTLDDLSKTDLRALDLTGTERTHAAIEDTVAQVALPGVDAPEQDLLSATSILHGDFQKVFEESEASIDKGDVGEDTGTVPSIAPSIDELDLEATGEIERTDITLDAEPTTMSEVGTKLDLARAYIDMGDPEGARSILDEVLKEGTAAQKQAAERLIVGLP